MEKPFDLKDLGERLKQQGLPVAEDMLEKLYKEISGWLKDSSQLHENGLVKSLVPVLLSVVDPLALKQIDKVDGKEG